MRHKYRHELKYMSPRKSMFDSSVFFPRRFRRNSRPPPYVVNFDPTRTTGSFATYESNAYSTKKSKWYKKAIDRLSTSFSVDTLPTMASPHPDYSRGRHEATLGRLTPPILCMPEPTYNQLSTLGRHLTSPTRDRTDHATHSVQ